MKNLECGFIIILINASKSNASNALSPTIFANSINVMSVYWIQLMSLQKLLQISSKKRNSTHIFKSHKMLSSCQWIRKKMQRTKRNVPHYSKCHCQNTNWYSWHYWALKWIIAIIISIHKYIVFLFRRSSDFY